jgi:hypothetical protein
MPFITQGKTNWKFLLIVIILAIIVGGGALWYSMKKEQPYQPVETKKPENVVEYETANWLTFNSISVAESYSEEYKLKYPREWFSESEKDEETHILTTIFKIKPDKIKLEVQVLPDEKKTLIYNSNNFYISDIKIGKNNFQELKDKNNENVVYIYKLDYKDNLSDNYYIVFKPYNENEQDKEILLTVLGTLQFLGRDKKGAIIGADKGSWQKIFKSEEYGFQIKYQNGLNLINNLSNDLSLIFVDGDGMYSNMFLVVYRLSGVSTAEEWLDRELTINKNASKKSEREYIKIKDSDKIGILTFVKDANGTIKNQSFYVSRGPLMYIITAPVIGTNEFAYYRMISNFELLEPEYKTFGLISKWGIENVFEFDEDLGKLTFIPNENNIYESLYKHGEIPWYETKVAGVVPEEIKTFFPAMPIDPQGLLSTNDWKKYQSKDRSFAFMYPKEWENESYSTENTLFFNVNKLKINPANPMLLVTTGIQPEPEEIFKSADIIQLLKFNNIESMITFIYGDEENPDPKFSYNKGVNCFAEFHAGSRDYFLQMYFNTGPDFNKNMQILYTILSSMQFYD